jgi:hypothetical protein
MSSTCGSLLSAPAKKAADTFSCKLSGGARRQCHGGVRGSREPAGKDLLRMSFASTSARKKARAESLQHASQTSAITEMGREDVSSLIDDFLAAMRLLTTH